MYKAQAWVTAVFSIFLIAGAILLPASVIAMSEKLSPAISQDLDRSDDGIRSAIILVREPEGLMPSFDGDNEAFFKALRRRAEVSQGRLIRKINARTVASGLPFVEYKSLWIVNALAVKADAALIRELSKNPEVEKVFRDERIDLPKTWAGEAHQTRAGYEWSLSTMNIPAVREKYGLDGKGVVVGHLDSGVDGTHPDLKGKILVFRDFSSTQSEAAIDDNGHGTHTAGTVAGGSQSGVAIGAAPGVCLVVGKIFSKSGATTAGILEAMQWVVDPDGNPSTNDTPDLCTNSWGGGDSGEGREMFAKAIKVWLDAGMIPVFAIGNSGPRPRTCGIPGGLLEVIAVGATDRSDKAAYFSSRGPVEWDGTDRVKPDITAPGHNVRSSWPGGGYNTISGTSMACPNVAGLIALLKQVDKGLDTEAVRRVLEETALDLGVPGRDNTFGSGRVDALKAVEAVMTIQRLSR